MREKNIVIPYTPRTCQLEIEQNAMLYRFLVAVCHRRFGKTISGVIRLIKSALQNKPDYRGYYIAPTQKQAKRLVWHYFKHYLRNFENFVEFNETELRIDFKISRNKPSIYLAGSENVEALRGIYIDDSVLDEMASWANAEYAFWEVLYPAMMDRKGSGFVIGTVKGLDLFYELHSMGQDKKRYSDWNTLIYPVTQTGVFDAKQIDELQRMMKSDAFEREFMCNFFAEVPDRLISPQEVVDAILRRPDHNHIKSSPEIWGMDVGFSTDPSKLAKRKGPLLKSIQTLERKDSTYQSAWLQRQIDQEHPKFVYIDAGYGEGIISNLTNAGYGNIVIPVWFGGASPTPACFNMRAFMYNEVKKWLRSASLPELDSLKKQLSNQLLDDTDSLRRIKLKPKKDIKDIIRESPDEADAVALTFAGGNDEVLTYNDAIQNPHGLPQDVIDSLMMKQLKEDGSYDPDTFLDNLLMEDIDIWS